MTYVKGSIGFSKSPGNWISKIIRWFTRSNWNHTFVVYQAEPEPLVVEASKFDVQLVPATKYDHKRYEVVYFTPSGYTPEAIEAGIACARRNIEKSYGWMQLVGFIPVIVFRRLFGMKISNPMKGGVICSELALKYLQGLESQSSWANMDRNAVSPEDLFEALSKDPRFTKSVK